MMPELQPAKNRPELEVIACSLEDAVAAYHGGASRLEVTVRLDQAGLTPPLDLVTQIAQNVTLPVRVMLRERGVFVLSGKAELDRLSQLAREFAGLNVDGLVMGHVKDGELDTAALAEIIRAAPALRVTVHHAIEETRDPIATLRALSAFPSVDRALVRGGDGTLQERIIRLNEYGAVFNPERSLIVGGDLSLPMLKPLRHATSINIFHLGRAVRTPEEAGGKVDSEKVRKAAALLGLETFVPRPFQIE